MNSLRLTDSEFRELTGRALELASGLYSRLDEMRAAPHITGEEARAAFAQDIPELGMRGAAFDALPRVIECSRAPTPRFFGYVLGSGEPVAAIGDFIASVINQNVTAWRSSPAAVTIERQVVGWIAAALGCSEFLGSLCGGGSAANLMALAMARESRAPANENGARAGMIYASSEVHMSIPKAMALLGLGRNNLRLIPADKEFRLPAADLEAAVKQDAAAGREMIAVVASAGTVNTGAIDPLEDVAAICRRYGLWMHVDGAYGALGALAAPDRFHGLNLADSLSADLHKWLYQPVDCGLLLFRDPAIARTAFSHSGDYVRVQTEDPVETFAFFDESMELSRRFRALKVWLSLRYHGLRAFRDAINADLDHAAQLAELIQRETTLELLAPVTLSAVCFRHAGHSPVDDLNSLNAAILKRLVDNGRVYLSNASINGCFALRACFVNHRTQPKDVELIVSEVRRAADEVAAEACTPASP